MKELSKLVKESTKAQRLLEAARARLAKVKKQKRPRQKTLESAQAAVDSARRKYEEKLGEIRGLAKVEEAEAERAPNPGPTPPASEPEPQGNGPSATVAKVVVEMIVSAHIQYMNAIDEALDMLERTPNPHARRESRFASPRGARR